MQGVAWVKLDGQIGYSFIDESGEEIDPDTMPVASLFSEGLAVKFPYHEDRKEYLTKEYGYVNPMGTWIIPPQYRFHLSTSKALITLYDFSDGLAAAHMDGKFGFINHSGDWQIPAQFDDVRPFSEGLAAARSGEQWGFINQLGAWEIEPQYKAVYPFSEGMAGVLSDGKLGFIDSQNNWTISPKFYSNESMSFSFEDLYYKYKEYVFHDGMAVALEVNRDVSRASPFRRQYGYLNTDGEWAIPPIFKTASPFIDGLARVTFYEDYPHEHTGYINLQGEIIVSWTSYSYAA